MAGVKNTFNDLSNHLFEQLEKLSDAEGKELEIEISRSKAIANVADRLIDLGNMAISAERTKIQYGKDIKLPRLLGGDE